MSHITVNGPNIHMKVREAFQHKHFYGYFTEIAVCINDAETSQGT